MDNYYSTIPFSTDGSHLTPNMPPHRIVVPATSPAPVPSPDLASHNSQLLDTATANTAAISTTAAQQHNHQFQQQYPPHLHQPFVLYNNSSNQQQSQSPLYIQVHPSLPAPNVPMNHYHQSHPNNTPIVYTTGSVPNNTLSLPQLPLPLSLQSPPPTTGSTTSPSASRNTSFSTNQQQQYQINRSCTETDNTTMQLTQSTVYSPSETTLPKLLNPSLPPPPPGIQTSSDITVKKSQSLATKISNILNHEYSNDNDSDNNGNNDNLSINNQNNTPLIPNPIGSTRSSISSLLSDPIPENVVTSIEKKNIDKIVEFNEKPNNNNTINNSNNNNNECIDVKKCDEENKEKKSTKSKKSKENLNLIKSNSQNSEMTVTKNKKSITLKISPKKNCKQKVLKIHLSSPTDSNNNNKDKNSKVIKKKMVNKSVSKKIQTKFVTIKINSDKFKNILDGKPINKIKEIENFKKLNKSNSNITDLKTNYEPVKITRNQAIEINHNNNNENKSNDANNLPSFFQLDKKSLPSIPKGYIPLIMSPEGKMYPMEFINVDSKSKSVSIMRPLWDGIDNFNNIANIPKNSIYDDKSRVDKKKHKNKHKHKHKSKSKKRKSDTKNDTNKILKKRKDDDDDNDNDHYNDNYKKYYYDGDDDSDDDNDTHNHNKESKKSKSRMNSQEFNSIDKVASLQLYLLSKESKINNKTFKVKSFKKYFNEINYYNRLLEREQLEYLENYKIERNYYQNLLNELETSDNMINFEKDLLEMRDYEIIREEIIKKYDDDKIYFNSLDKIIELQSMQCLDYSTRLIKLKNYLNMERVRLERHKNRLCRINTNKSNSIWKRYIKSDTMKFNNNNNNESNSSSTNNFNYNFNFQLISQNDFMLLTNANSRSYGTYVLNNSIDKGNENQNEIIELIEYFLPDKSILKDLFKEMKKNENKNNIIDKNLKNTSINSIEKNDMISKYGLKESSSSNIGNRLLKELQIDGMDVDIERNDRVERRGSGQRKSRNRFSSSNSSNSNNKFNEFEDLNFEDVNNSNNLNEYNNRNNYRNGTRNNNEQINGNNNSNYNNSGFHYNSNLNYKLDINNEFKDVNDDYEYDSSNNNNNNNNENNENGGNSTGTGSRHELNITSCLDSTLCDIDRVKMMNLDCKEIGINFTKIYGMPKGLQREEIDSDLIFLRNSLKS